MAAASDCVAVRKCFLQNTFMHVKHVRSGFGRKLINFKFKMTDFSRKKEKIFTTNPLPYKDWILNISKNKNAVTLTLRTSGESIHDVKGRVRYSKISTSKDISVNKISNDKYVVHISSEIIHAPKDLLMVDEDCLFCELDVILAHIIKINRPVSENIIPRFNEAASSVSEYETEEMVLVEDLKYSPDVIDFTDFKIKLKDSVRYVHKCILAARSKFFFSYFKNNPDSEEMELDASSETFDLMHMYMYKGVIIPRDVWTTLALMKLVKKLEMEKPYEMCLNFLVDLIPANNVPLIRQIGNNMGDDILVSVADDFLASK